MVEPYPHGNSMTNYHSTTNHRTFWADIAPGEHLVHIYNSDEILLDVLENFARAGFDKGEAVVLIATPIHLAALNSRLISAGYDLESLRSGKDYVTLDADDSLRRFMVDGVPDDALFRRFIAEVLAELKGKRVRAFGEMVALLWERGQSEAVLSLERSWHAVCQEERLPLLCAYPRSGFSPAEGPSVWQICDTHSRVVP
jgi:hypothetical protein